MAASLLLLLIVIHAAADRLDPLLLHEVSLLQVGIEMGDEFEVSLQHVANAYSVSFHGNESADVNLSSLQKKTPTIGARIDVAREGADAQSFDDGGVIAVAAIVIVAVLFFFAILVRVPVDDEQSDMKNALASREVANRLPISAERSVSDARPSGGAAGNSLTNIGSGATTKTSQAGTSFGSVPPICPSLILQETEARFVVPMDRLTLKMGKIGIQGTSGKTLLNASLEDLPDGRRRLQLASAGVNEPPRTTIVSPQQPGGAFELTGQRGDPYGTLEMLQDNSGVCVLKFQGQPVMHVELGVPPDFKMTAKSLDGDGRELGKGGRTENENNWMLKVMPGADAVLITTCMLAMIFMRAESGRPCLI